MKRTLVALALLSVGIAALSYAARGQGHSPLGIVVALAAFIAAATLISRACAMAVQLRSFLGRMVTVRAWGTQLPDGEAFEVASVRAIGAGLHIYLRPQTAVSPIHLKVAQPKRAEITTTSVRIHEAKYIQWAGKRLPRPDSSAPALVLEADQ